MLNKNCKKIKAWKIYQAHSEQTTKEQLKDMWDMMEEAEREYYESRYY